LLLQRRPLGAFPILPLAKKELRSEARTGRDIGEELLIASFDMASSVVRLTGGGGVDESLQNRFKISGKARDVCFDQRPAADDSPPKLKPRDKGEDHCGSLTCPGTLKEILQRLLVVTGDALPQDLRCSRIRGRAQHQTKWIDRFIVRLVSSHDRRGHLLCEPCKVAVKQHASGKRALDGSGEKFLFRAEIPIHEDGGHASLLRDLPNPNPVIAMARERGQRRLQNSLAGDGRVSRPPGFSDRRWPPLSHVYSR
jgi:hypothetical protein